jgi:hypothetical protein
VFLPPGTGGGTGRGCTGRPLRDIFRVISARMCCALARRSDSCGEARLRCISMALSLLVVVVLVLDRAFARTGFISSKFVRPVEASDR